MVRCVARASAAAVISVMVLAAPASAQDAKVLFEQGRAAMERRDYETACQRFRESERTAGNGSVEAFHRAILPDGPLGPRAATMRSAVSGKSEGRLRFPDFRLQNEETAESTSFRPPFPIL